MRPSCTRRLLHRALAGLFGACVVLVLAGGCESTSPSAPPADGPPVSDRGAADVRDAALRDTTVDGPAADLALDSAADLPADAGPTYRNSLSVCWTTPSCKRALAIAHGGTWSLTKVPYLSNAALAAAYAAGYDGVKIDVRVTKDKVSVLAHSSPIEFYESLDCANQKIEEMTVAQVTACHRVPSSTETFQRFTDVLNYLRGKMIAQLTVKRPDDYAKAIADVLAANAQDYAFFEISPDDLSSRIPNIAGSDKVYYLINVASTVSNVDVLLGINNPRAFMYEFDPGVQIQPTITTKLTAAGIRTFIYDNSLVAPASTFEGYYNSGFDVVSSQSGLNGLNARVAINKARGISPP